MNPSTRKRSILKRIARIVLKTFLFTFLFFLLIVLLILTPPVQNFIKKKTVAYLESKLDTKISIGKIFIGLPKKVVVEDVFIEDRQKDTLLFAGSLKVNVGLLKLIFKGEVDINSIEVKNSTAKIKRSLPDTAFNFQFIVDAFSPANTTTTKTDTSPGSSITISTVRLDKVRFVYKDIVTGNDIESWIDHFDTKIDKMDPDHLVFDIPEVNIDGLVAKVYQAKPLVTAEPVSTDRAEAAEPVNLQLDLKKISLSKIQLDYRNDVSALYSSLKLDKASISVNKFDLANRLIDLREVSVEDLDGGIHLGKSEVTAVLKNEVVKEVETHTQAGWRLMASSIEINNNNLRFGDDNAPVQNKGMDYAHLQADSLTLHVKDFVLSNDSIGGNIVQASLKEKSGFVLQELETEFLYSGTHSYLEGLYLKTPGTELKRSASIHYASIDALKTDIGNMQLEADIENSKVLVNDILFFAPFLRQQPAFANPSATWYINSRIKGRIADMQIDELELRGLRDTRIDIEGRVAGLPDMKNAVANLTIREISSSKRDVDLFLPGNTLPPNLTLPSRFSASGKIKGNTAAMNASISLRTDLGNASLDGRFEHIADPGKIEYDAAVQTTSFDIGRLLQQNENLGPVTASFVAKGRGLDPKTASAALSGKIQSAVFKQYNYKDIDFNGSLANQQVKMNTRIIDPNIHFDLSATADLSKQYPAVIVHAVIDSIKMQELHLTSNKTIYRGKIEANFPVTNPDSLQGRLFITESLLIREEKRLQLDTIRLLAGNSDTGHYMLLNSSVANAELTGQYKLTELGNIFQQAIQPYFAVQPAGSAPSVQPYNFRLNAYIINNPALQTLIPGLERMDSIRLQSHFSDKEGWSALLIAPVVDIGTNHIRQLRLEAGTAGNKINMTATIQQFRSGASIELSNATLNASLADNKIDFVLNIKDRNQKDKYNIGGMLEQLQARNYTISIKPRDLLLNYDTWTISENNKLIINGKKINAADLTLSRAGQQLSITSHSQQANAPMEANFSNFRLVTLTGFVQSDSTFADGTINGKLTLIDLTSNPVFTSDLTVNDFRLKGDTVGNVHLLVNNKVSNTYNADVTITGKGNDVHLSGNYNPVSGADNLDFTLDIRQMPLTTAQAFSNRSIRSASGSVNGQFKVSGTIDKPAVNGDLHFNQAAFIFSMLNSRFSIDQEKIGVNSSGIRFDNFAIKDSAGNQLLLNGTAATSNFRNYKFDMRIRANNFQALNSTRKDNRLFYGLLYFNTNLTLKGSEELPVIDGRLTINEETKMTVLLPQREPGVVEREGIVEFVDRDAPLNDSLFMAAYDSFNTSGFTGMEISVVIEVDKEADLTLIVDEGNGDFLNVKGEALITTNIDRSGKIFMSGTYDLESGAYELSFNLLKRKFLIEKGSKITWEGEPTKATVNVTGKYIANVAPLDLVKSQLSEDITTTQRNTYLQRLPFDVILRMEGELMQPKITFDIILPDNKSYVVPNDIITNVRTRLEQLRQEEGEMNKQVFSLLLLNRFVAENPFDFNNGTNASMLARQSVSKLMTEQLNRLATELVKGVDINFDIQSSEDYTTGARKDRTDLNVGLSKQLLNDNLTVTVGSNFELEGPQNSSQQGNNIAGNVALDYKLSRDGRYLLRAYRKNEYQGIIDGYVVETGVGFIITVDYNRFSEIFQSFRKRQRQRKNNQAEQKEPAATTATQTEPLKQ